MSGKFWKVLAAGAVGGLGVVIMSANLVFVGEPQITYLAHSFLAGKNYFLSMPGSWEDAVNHDGKYYWASAGVVPILLQVPGVWGFRLAGEVFHQGYGQIAMAGLTMLGIYAISRKTGFSRVDSGFTVLAFTGASMYPGTAALPLSWQLVQVTAVFLVVLAIYHYQAGRWGTAGMLMGLVAATRLTAGLGTAFFLLEILRQRRGTVKRILLLVLPLAFGLGLTGWYNWARFGSVLDSGYSRPLLPEKLQKNKSYGLFSPVHVPTNLFYMLLNGPDPVFRETGSRVLAYPYIKADPWGMSILLTSPYLITLFARKHRDGLVKNLWLTIAIIGAPIVMYFAIGYFQFGYRYALDFWPWLFMIWLITWPGKREIPERMRWLILGSAGLNIYLLAGMWGWIG